MLFGGAHLFVSLCERVCVPLGSAIYVACLRLCVECLRSSAWYAHTNDETDVRTRKIVCQPIASKTYCQLFDGAHARAINVCRLGFHDHGRHTADDDFFVVGAIADVVVGVFGVVVVVAVLPCGVGRSSSP